ncbi:hypothetical protein PoMZ_07846 [Pyricularia oryzae]|uniref:Uncharacterized protein n=1 Tax=Pyricularia oryzae TaxID=318829 RepID=A0A4P7NG73_PYROR|nr:hypothetical protein PoMZ_07846 [Pyricularia oryzae]
MVNSRTASARESQDLLGATDVGSAHGCVGVHQVDSGASVNNHVEVGSQLIKVLVREPEALSTQVSGHHLNSIHDGRIPYAQVKEVLANSRHTAGFRAVGRSSKTDKAKNASRCVLYQRLQEERAKIASHTGEQDSLSLIQRAHGGFSRLDVIGKDGISLEDRSADDFHMAVKGRSSGEASHRHRKPKGIGETTRQVSQSQGVTSKIKEVMLRCNNTGREIQ